MNLMTQNNYSVNIVPSFQDSESEMLLLLEFVFNSRQQHQPTHRWSKLNSVLIKRVCFALVPGWDEPPLRSGWVSFLLGATGHDL